jgi:Kef-type K+ transport system membrane component KefB
MSDAGATSTPMDPVAARREAIARWNTIASRTGYGLYAVSVVTFFIGLWWGLTDVMHLISGAALVVGSIILAPSIVITYGVRAARREDEAAKKSASGNT